MIKIERLFSHQKKQVFVEGGNGGGTEDRVETNTSQSLHPILIPYRSEQSLIVHISSQRLLADLF